MPNVLTGTINASAPTQVAVGVASTTLATQNTNRQGLVVTNLSTGTVYLGLAGNTAVLGSGIVLLPNGGSWVMDEFNYNNETVTAIAHSALSAVAVQEFIR